MKKLYGITILILGLFLTINSKAQSGRSRLIGIQPAVTVEPFYEEGEFDINIFPFVYEMRMGMRTNLRLVPIVNYHFGGEENGVSDLGLSLVMPVFIKPVESLEAKTYGFYLGPVFGFGRNALNEHYTATLALEPGYMWETQKSFTINLGLQLGTSYFINDAEPNEWLFHWGPKVTFGFWF